MHHAGDFGVLRHDAKGILVRLPVVDDDRQMKVAGKRHLRAEAGRLRRRIVLAVVIVEPDLADGDDLGVLGHGGDLIEPAAVLHIVCRVGGMHADGGADEGEAVGKGERRAACGKA